MSGGIILKIIIFLILIIKLEAQPSKFQKELGEQLFKEKQYTKAYQALKQYHQNRTDDDKALLMIAVCAYQINEIEEANRYLNLIARRATIEEAKLWQHQARVAHAMGRFERATSLYKQYLKSVRTADQRVEIKKELIQCANGLRLNYQKRLSVEAFDTNTQYCEQLLKPSPTQKNVYYFTSDRKGNQDIYVQNGAAIALLDGAINTAQNEYLIGFSKSGQQLFFYREDTLKMAQLGETATTLTLPPFDMQTPYWFSDSIVLFSSDQLAGYGGFDLFYTRWQQNGWSNPTNLGSIINSTFDERSPVLANDGCTLFFSSNQAHRSLGQSDVFIAQFDRAQEAWRFPQNLGISMNSYANEYPNALIDSTKTLFFTSDNWEGAGAEDIYFADLSPIIEWQSPALFFDDVQLHQLDLVERISNQKLIYRILIATEDIAKLPSNFPSPFTVKQNERSNYYIGQYSTFQSAVELQNELSKRGCKTTEIVPFLDESIIDKEQAKALISKFSDLQDWLEGTK